MRLTRNQVEFIAHRIAKDLIEKGRIESDDPAKLIEGFVQLITQELMVEDQLMFKMIKKKLARERDIIL